MTDPSSPEASAALGAAEQMMRRWRGGIFGTGREKFDVFMAEYERRGEMLEKVGQLLQEMAASGDLSRYVIQDCADALLEREGAPGSRFDNDR
jgi:hypothetical protein